MLRSFRIQYYLLLSLLFTRFTDTLNIFQIFNKFHYFYPLSPTVFLPANFSVLILVIGHGDTDIIINKYRMHTKIKRLRRELGITQEEMAEYLHISQNAYSSIERGHTRIDLERLKTIAKKLKVDVEGFLNTNTADTKADAEVITNDWTELVKTKDKQIQQLLLHNLQLLETIEKMNTAK